MVIVVFLKNAWVCEDAYITFRSIEQLFAGNGPVWNPHERVQVYTSALWYFLLSFFRLFSDNLFLMSLLVSFLLLLVTVHLLRRLLKSDLSLFFMALLLVASSAFFDFTSSGLENGLAYLLLIAYILVYLSISDSEHDALARKKQVPTIFWLAGLLILTRHDLLILIFPSLIYLLKKNWSFFSIRKWLGMILMGFSPFLLFTVFSLVYYGFPFPNTAYAKLNTGISQIDLIRQGWAYLLSSIRHDPMTLLVIGLSLVLLFFRPKARPFLPLALGVVLNLIYVVWVGGDFMQGRFLSYSYLVCATVLAFYHRDHRYAPKPYLWGVIFLFLLFFPHTPFNSGINHANLKIKNGIADERGFYFNDLSLIQYVLSPVNEPFPSNFLAKQGRFYKMSPEPVFSVRNIGIQGYLAGTDKIIVDTLGLGNPLLARLPAKKEWRIGHFERDLPAGYLESLLSGKNMFKGDDPLRDFYGHLKLVTQSATLLSLQRLKTIVLFNLGYYNRLLKLDSGESALRR